MHFKSLHFHSFPLVQQFLFQFPARHFLAQTIIHLSDKSPGQFPSCQLRVTADGLLVANTMRHAAHVTSMHTAQSAQNQPIFTALHAMQTRSSDENSVRLSVCPSVCPSVCLSHACIVTKR